MKNHGRSLYRDHNNSQSDATAIGNFKHIASQNIAPSSNVFTEAKARPTSGLKQSSHAVYHQKNQSIDLHLGRPKKHARSVLQNEQQKAQARSKAAKETGSVTQKFNNSVNSNLSKGTKNSRKKAVEQNIHEQRLQVQARQANSKDRQFTKINMSNEKGKQGLNKYQNNIVYSKSKDRQQSGSKSRA